MPSKNSKTDYSEDEDSDSQSSMKYYGTEENDNEPIDSIILETNGYDKDEFEKAIAERRNKILNNHLTKIEKEIYLAIKYGDADKIRDLGGGEQLDLNFRIEIEKDIFYYPIQLAAAIGESECLKFILENKQTEIDVVDDKIGVNAFWFACYYGRGECASLLANAGINVLNKHKKTHANGLHVAIEQKNYRLA